MANVGTAVVPYAQVRRYSQGLALGYVAVRLVEAMFIGIGIISMLTFLFMRQKGTAGSDPALGQVSSRSTTGRSWSDPASAPAWRTE